MSNNAGVLFIGIDPGVSGGMAILTLRGRVVDVTAMPPTPELMHRWLAERIGAKGIRGEAYTVVEFVTAFAPKGMKMGATSAMTFGRNLGRIDMLLIGLNLPWTTVVPMKWQDALECRTGGDKNISKARAVALFPKLTVTHAIADALLIAEYCRRLHTGRLNLTSADRGTHGKESRKEEGRAGEGRQGEGRRQGQGQAAREANGPDRRRRDQTARRHRRAVR